MVHVRRVLLHDRCLSPLEVREQAERSPVKEHGIMSADQLSMHPRTHESFKPMQLHTNLRSAPLTVNDLTGPAGALAAGALALVAGAARVEGRARRRRRRRDPGRASRCIKLIQRPSIRWANACISLFS